MLLVGVLELITLIIYSVVESLNVLAVSHSKALDYFVFTRQFQMKELILIGNVCHVS